MRPREWLSLGTEHLCISSQWTRQIVEPSWSSAALANSLDRKYIFPAHLQLLLLRQNRTTKPTQQGKLREKKLLLLSANTKPLGASA